MNVLLVEPDALLAQSYREALVRAGHAVVVAPTAQTAIHSADRQRPDLVLLELQLVSHSGIEFLYEFRSYPDWYTIPAIILSHVPRAEFSDSWSLLHDELGVLQYLYKPQTSLAHLQRTVAEFATLRA